ncbi:hypothetical protein [Coraliomargarita parva]|uniref:hypothetical protein n=1 Tax=Coraliomargarita parva TaxID=3014050 RepID=UPI0022B37909|nr:hypothetical protein [Coraliomargarita parva]
MRKLLQALSLIALIGVIAPPVLFLAGSIELPAVHRVMLIATVAWFLLTPLWMGRNEPAGD